MNKVLFAPFEPDKAALQAGHSSEAFGVIPSASGYSPLRTFLADPEIPALPSRCIGAYSFYTSDGNGITVAGTNTNLYQLQNNGWQNIGDGYSANAVRWDFARYGDTLIAVNGYDSPLYAAITNNAVSQFQPVDGAPVASSVEIVKEFVVLGGVETSKIRWSAMGDPLDWPSPGTNDAQYKQSDEQDFPDTGQTVNIAGALNGMDLLVFNERATYRGQYIGSPYFFQFDVLDKGRGCLAPGSVVTGINAIYFLSEDGFIATDGSSMRNIGFEKVNLWFREMSDDLRRHEVTGTHDPITGIIIWTFAGRNAPADSHDYLIVHHPILDRWSYGKSTVTHIFRGISKGRTLEDLDVFGPLETLPHSLDSKAWSGGVSVICGFTSDNEFAYMDGESSSARIDTEETGGERMMIHGVRPLIDAAEAGASILFRDFISDPLSVKACSSPSAINGVCYCHISTRYARARIEIPGGTDWKHAMGCDVLLEKEGSL